jgi:hypothetical protein
MGNHVLTGVGAVSCHSILRREILGESGAQVLNAASETPTWSAEHLVGAASWQSLANIHLLCPGTEHRVMSHECVLSCSVELSLPRAHAVCSP